MATAYALGSFRNAIKPVGEQILVDYVNSQALGDGDTVSWEYDIPANLVVTDVTLVKTASNPTALSTIKVEVIKVDQAGAETAIYDSTAIAAAAFAKGVVVRAGGGADLLLANGSSGSLTSRLVAVASQNLGATSSSNSQQQLKIKITIGTGISAGEAAMLIRLNLARFSSVNSKFDEVVTVES